MLGEISGKESANDGEAWRGMVWQRAYTKSKKPKK